MLMPSSAWNDRCLVTCSGGDSPEEPMFDLNLDTVRSDYPVLDAASGPTLEVLEAICFAGVTH